MLQTHFLQQIQGGQQIEFIESPGNSRNSGKAALVNPCSSSIFSGLPRPIRTWDLYACEQHRADVPDAYVLHGGVDYSPSDRKHIQWIVNGNRVRAVHGREARELARRLKA